MKRSLLFGCAALLSVCALILVVTGASLTQSRAAGGAPLLSPEGHRLVGEIVGTLAILLALAVTFTRTIAPSINIKVAVWLPVAIVIADAAAGAAAPGTSHLAGFFHSLLAQLFFAATVLVATVLSLPPAAAPVADKGWPSLRGYAMLTCILVILQVTLGAAFRHELMGVLWHIIGALLLALFILGLALLVLNLPPESAPNGNPLRGPAIFLIIFAGVQLTLGMTVISLQATSPALAAVTVTHAATGALTLACTVALTMLVRHHAQRVK